MKTINQVKQHIAEAERYYLTAKGERAELPPPVFKGKPKEQKALLKQCLMYLETNPSADFVVAQLDMVDKEIDVINNNYKLFNPKEIKFKSETAKRRYYNRIFGLTRLKNQAITLKYLLKEL